MQTKNQNPIVDWFDGDPFSVTPTNKGIKYYSRWRSRSLERRNKKIESRCHYFEVVAWEWFSREPVLWFLRPWMIAGLIVFLAFLSSSLYIWRSATVQVLTFFGAVLASLVIFIGLFGVAVWYMEKHEDKFDKLDRNITAFLKDRVWPPLRWFFTKRFLRFMQPWSALVILVLAGFFAWKPEATFTVLWQFGLLVLLSVAIIGVLVGVAVGLVYLTDIISDWRRRRPTKSKQTIYYPTTEPNRVAQIYEEAHWWYKVRKYGCPIGPIDPKIDQL